MISNRNKIIYAIIAAIIFSMGFATDFSDSLEARIDKTQGLEKIDAQLELSYYYRRTKIEFAKELAQEAFNKIEQNYSSDLNRKLRATLYLGMTLYYSRDYVNALDMLYEGVTIAKDIRDNYLLAELYYFIGATHYFYYGDSPQAIDYYNKSILAGLESDNYWMLGAVYSALSTIFRVNGSYEKSLEFIFKSRDYYSKAGYKEGTAWVEYVTGNLFKTVGLYEEAQGAYTRSLHIYRELAADNNHMTGVAICLDQLTVVHRILGNYNLAGKYVKEAIDFYKQDNSMIGLSNSLKYWGELEFSKGNHDFALTLLDSSLALKKQYGELLGLPGLYDDLGALFIEQEQYNRALDTLEVGLSYAIKNNQVNPVVNIYKHLSEVYEKLGQYDVAYKYKSLEVEMADSIYSAKTTRNMLQLGSLYEIESKENEIKQLEKDKLIAEISLTKHKQIQIFLSFVIILAVIILLLFIYLFRSKVKLNDKLKESKRVIEASNATKDKFFSILGHDLRTPYNSLLGLLGILKKKHQTMNSEEREKIINTLYDALYNNFGLLNNLLEWSRSQRGMIIYHSEPFFINQIAKDVKELLRTIWKEKDIEIIINEDPIHVIADKNMIHTIFRNLISNAIKYSHPKSKIEISIEQDNEQTHIQVKDNGIGINKEDINRLFKIDTGFKIEGTAGEKGTGLGLVVCQDFIEQHHGKIWAESEAGSGSTFHFTIPNAK
jgi:signal transduction histidine kinase